MIYSEKWFKKIFFADFKYSTVLEGGVFDRVDKL
jgi:hypothetical protein